MSNDHHAEAAKRAAYKNYDYMHIVSTNRGFSVKGYDTWPSHSVLAGQVRKSFIDSFESHELELAKEFYPEATLSHELMEPMNTFDHLSDEPDSW